MESVALDTDAVFLARKGPVRASRSALRRAAPTRSAIAARIFQNPGILAAVRTTNVAVVGVSRATGLVKPQHSMTGTHAAAEPRAAAEPHAATQPHAATPSHAAGQPDAGRLRRAVESHTPARQHRINLARRAAHPSAAPRRSTYRRVVIKHARVARSARRVALGGGMSAVIAYARSQVGRSYVTGGEGGSGFDCSGLVKRAYAQAGIALPHSSRAQAARAHNISRRVARAGDLVVGPGHVGIYMGHGMMIDAGNHRTGVVYRKLYSGLRVARF